jgi:hypothetical protein
MTHHSLSVWKVHQKMLLLVEFCRTTGKTDRQNR